jgi:hypothetical protein
MLTIKFSGVLWFNWANEGNQLKKIYRGVWHNWANEGNQLEKITGGVWHNWANIKDFF